EGGRGRAEQVRACRQSGPERGGERCEQERAEAQRGGSVGICGRDTSNKASRRSSKPCASPRASQPGSSQERELINEEENRA
ncbi:MAG: hypothetical protein ACPIOQ_42530, partial [Promethearchaeia archaeon]